MDRGNVNSGSGVVCFFSSCASPSLSLSFCLVLATGYGAKGLCSLLFPQRGGTYGDVDAVIGEDEGGVGSGELRVGHGA